MAAVNLGNYLTALKGSAGATGAGTAGAAGTGTDGTAGTTGTGTTGNTGNGGWLGTILNGIFGNKNKNNIPNNRVDSNTAANEALKNNLNQLKEDYQKQIRENYDYNAGKIRADREEGLRDSFLSHKKDMAGLREKMASIGVTGGGAQSNLTKLQSDYENKRNEAWENSRQQLADAGNQMQQEAAEGNREYNEAWLQYLMDLHKEKAGKSSSNGLFGGNSNWLLGLLGSTDTNKGTTT